MPYSAEISRANPSCFQFLIDRSGSMFETFGGKTKADAVADAINRLLQNLTIKCAKSEGVRDYYEVGVIGYGSKVGPAFGGPLAGRHLVPISQVAQAPTRVEERVKKVSDGAGGLVDQKIKFPIWFEAVASGGTLMSEAFRQAFVVLQDWIEKHPKAYPPIVINITDGESTDGDPAPNAAALTSLETADGNVLLFNCHISADSATPILFPADEGVLSDDFARMLFRMSSDLPERLGQAARAEGMKIGPYARGFVFNADLVELIRFLDIGTRPSNLR